MKRNITITAGILAGGKSSRMGSCKSFLSWQETTFLEHIAALFSDFPQCVVSVDLKEKFEHIKWAGNVVLVEDVRKEYGPMEGIYRLLLTAEEDRVFIVATDMPLLNREFIYAFADADLEQADIMIAAAGAACHPLCGIYSKKCIPAIEKLFEQGEHSIKALLEESGSRQISVESLGFSTDILTNVNTIQDYNFLYGME